MASVSVLWQSGHVALAAAFLLFCGVAASAQAGPVNPQGQAGAQSPARTPAPKHPRAHAGKHGVKSAPEPAPVVETRPPDPPPPKWPANEQAEAASVGWDGRDLSIAATNSSLQQILRDVSTATGVKVEGIASEQHGDIRIYGSYGPASARDVLGKLLEGSGYNVMMIGDTGQGTPRELVLTAKAGSHAGAGQSNQAAGAQNQGQDEEAEEQPEPPEQPEPVQRRPIGMPPQGPMQGRSPQQLIQDMQQRQQQIQQQQQQQQGLPNPAGPP